jgi:hypothetical protein
MQKKGMFFDSILQTFPLPLRLAVLKVVKRKTEIEYHRLRLETEPRYVLERMGLKFLHWEPFSYRGHVFTAQKIFLQPSSEDDVPYAYQVRLGICRKEEIPDRTAPRNEIYIHSRETTRTYQEKFSLDCDRCHFESLLPLMENLIANFPMEEEDYDIVLESEEQKQALELLEQCSIRFPINVLYSLRSLLLG